MKFAVIGTDISGMVAAYLFSRRHEVVVFKQYTPPSPQLMASFPPIVLKKLRRKLCDSNGPEEKLMQY
jgi:hypothetical protein